MKAKISFGKWLLKKFDTIEQKLSKFTDKEYVNKAINKNIFDYLIIKDCNTSYKYYLKIRDGVLITEVLPIGFTLNKEISLYDGDIISTKDLDISLVYPNGNKEKITNWDKINISNISKPLTKQNNKLFLSYVIDGEELFDTTLDLTVKDFDPAAILVDFDYTDNGDGTYIITDWKQTLNGESSTELIIPNNTHIRI